MGNNYCNTCKSSYGLTDKNNQFQQESGLANEVKSGNLGYNPMNPQNPHELDQSNSNTLYANLSEDGKAIQGSYIGQLTPDGSGYTAALKPEDEEKKKKEQEDDLTDKTLSFDFNPKEQEDAFKENVNTDGNTSSWSVEYNHQHDLGDVVEKGTLPKAQKGLADGMTY